MMSAPPDASTGMVVALERASYRGSLAADLEGVVGVIMTDFELSFSCIFRCASVTDACLAGRWHCR